MKRTITIINIVSILVLLAVTSARAADRKRLYTVKVNSGDTLHGIANMYLKDPSRWPEIHKYNKNIIDDPHIILPETTINIPIDMLKVEKISIRIKNMQNKVQIRKKGASTWENVSKDTELLQGDSLKTFIRSYVSMEFITGGVLRIGENSLVVLETKDKEEVQLVNGKVRASRIKINTGFVSAKPSIKDDSDYIVEIKENKTVKISVFKGKVDVSNLGKQLTLSEGYMIEINYSHPPESRNILLVDCFELKKNMVVETESFQFQIAVDEEFKETVYRKTCIVNETDESLWKSVYGSELRGEKYNSLTSFLNELFEHANIDSNEIGEGEYHWRLLFEDSLGIEKKSLTKSFYVDKTPPKIEILSPLWGKEVKEQIIKIKGIVEKDCIVIVNGKNAQLFDGKFCIYVPLKPGLNKINFTAIDKANNKNVLIWPLVRTSLN